MTEFERIIKALKNIDGTLTWIAVVLTLTMLAECSRFHP
jgi:hypothetical protein